MAMVKQPLAYIAERSGAPSHERWYLSLSTPMQAAATLPDTSALPSKPRNPPTATPTLPYRQESLSFAVVVLVASIPLAMEIVTTTTLAMGSRCTNLPAPSPFTFCPTVFMIRAGLFAPDLVI